MDQEQDRNNIQAPNNNNFIITENQRNLIIDQNTSNLNGDSTELYIVRPEFKQRGPIHYNILINTLNIIQ